MLPWTRVTADNRDGLVGRIPRRPLATPQPFCLDCALQLAAQVTISFIFISIEFAYSKSAKICKCHGQRLDEFISFVSKMEEQN